MATKLDVGRVLSAINSKQVNFYAGLTDEERKAFNPFILLRYTSNALGDRDIQEWFIDRTQTSVNKNYWSVGTQHKELQWLLYSTVGVGAPCRHQYLAAQPKTKQDKFVEFLASINPSMKMADITVMAELMSEVEREEVMSKFGLDQKEKSKYK